MIGTLHLVCTHIIYKYIYIYTHSIYTGINVRKNTEQKEKKKTHKNLCLETQSLFINLGGGLA